MNDPGRDAEPRPAHARPARVPLRIDTVRRQFDRRAAHLAKHDFLLREIARRLADRLDYMRVQPLRVLDVGCGAGAGCELLTKRYRGATWIGADASPAMLGARPAHGGVLRAILSRIGRRTGAKVCADGGRLPFADASFDLVFSNLMLHWHPAPDAVFPEWLRVLAVDGLLLFSCFGPDTLKELRAACREALPDARPMTFVDMHDFGDMMVAAGFATPVMDVETIRLTYDSPRALLAEVRALGGNPRSDRAPGLVSGRRGRALLAALERGRDETGRIALSFEVAYGHAWKPKARDRNRSVISLDRLRAGLAAPGAGGGAAPGSKPR